MSAHNADQTAFVVRAEEVVQSVANRVVVQRSGERNAQITSGFALFEVVAVNATIVARRLSFGVRGIVASVEFLGRIERRTVHIVGHVDLRKDQTTAPESLADGFGQRATEKNAIGENSICGHLRNGGKVQITKYILIYARATLEQNAQLIGAIDFDIGHTFGSFCVEQIYSIYEKNPIFEKNKLL